jgi:transcription-repair coupling factor (superfamily II helicase)
MALFGLTEYLSSAPQIKVIVDAVLRGERAVLCGTSGSSRSAALSAVLGRVDKPAFILLSSAEGAERVHNELRSFFSDDVCLFPSPDTIPFEAAPPSKTLVGERLAILNRLLAGEKLVIVSSVKAAISRTIPQSFLKSSRTRLKTGMKLSIRNISKKLVSLGYDREDIVGERGEFSVRGGIVDIFPSTGLNPVRVDFFGDEIEAIKFFDVKSQRSLSKVKEVTILPSLEAVMPLLREGVTTIFDYIKKGTVLAMEDEIQIILSAERLFSEAMKTKADEEFLRGEKTKLKGPPYLPVARLRNQLSKFPVLEIASLSQVESEKKKFVVTMNFAPPESFVLNRDAMISELKGSSFSKIIVVSKQGRRALELLSEAGIEGGGVSVVAGDLRGGFKWAEGKLLLLTDKEIFGERLIKGTFKAAPTEGVDSSLLVDISIGDYVVHERYGIGKYGGLERLAIDEVEQEYLLIKYAGDDKLYVPLSQIGLVQKYSSSGDYSPKLNSLGGTEWARTRKRAEKSLEDMTEELLELYATREAARGFAFAPDSLWQVELEAGFPYEETVDQARSIKHVKEDMESNKPMDRLVCGDVGYGKTEVALRAAFKAASSGKQVALLVPTTILAEQHYNNFKERFAPFPVSVEMLSRFRSKGEQREIIERLALGGVDIIIGTHRLLQDDVKFKDLGLVIIDEEQRFGVKHKEKLKKLRRTVDIITMTATPIPRTLYMSLSGARDMSMIGTPPADRSPIKTYVMEWRGQVVREAILRELERGGQIYYVYNFVEDIESRARAIKELVPQARVAVAHGQMGEGRLEKTMLDFMSREYDVLLCTTIIESGIDIPNVNTIIIDHASRFGLAQLYQLRGRVGRSSARAYAYLLYEKEDLATGAAIERLQAIREYTSLGSGYRLALRDLEIRGAGNLLGKEQHGHMLALGFDLYCDLMERAVAKAKGQVEVSPKEIAVDLKVDAYIPGDYITDERQRIAYYRRLNLIGSGPEIEEMIEEIEDRFGKMPAVVKVLFEIINLKVEAKKAGIKKIEEKDNVFTVSRMSGKRVEFKLKRSTQKRKLDMLRSMISTLSAS